MKSKYITFGTALAFIANFLLFAIKLYIGLSANSISIYSDAVNNLFDSLSGLLSFICLRVLLKGATLSSKGIIKKSEELLSFIVSVAVGITGFSFAYSSAERLMYPTPVWYEKKYLYILCATAAFKLILHFIFRYLYKKSDSTLLKAISLDSVLDFFITGVTVLSLVLSSSGKYSIDAFCGIGISVFLIISAVKMIVSAVKKLLSFVPKDKRLEIETALFQLYKKENVDDITFLGGGERASVLVSLKSRTKEDEKSDEIEKIANELGISLHIIEKERSVQEKLYEYENED